MYVQLCRKNNLTWKDLLILKLQKVQEEAVDWSQ